MKRIGYMSVAFALMLTMLLPMSLSSAQLAFEAATIKPQEARTLRMAGGGCHGIDTVYPANAVLVPPLGRCLITFSLSSLVSIAYSPVAPAGGISGITGEPDWTDSDFWLVEGKAENTATAKEAELKEMLQTLLVERFKLRFHHEMREISGYALVIAKGGLKITEDSSDNTNEPIVSAGPSGLVYRKAPLSLFANFLSGPAGGPVIDKTGLTGRYSFSFKPPRPQLAVDPRDNDPAAPSIFTLIQDELGLRLEPTKLPANFIVIDHVEKPSEN